MPAFPLTSISISNAEYQQRLNRLQEHLAAQSFSGVILTNRDYLLYYTGFAFIPTERPIAFVMNAAGETGMFVPRLELEHAQSRAVVQRVDHYLEYPSNPHPMDLFRKMLEEMSLFAGDYAADHDGYPWIFGYRGPTFTDMAGQPPRPIIAFIEDQMMLKSPAEIALIKESIQWANLAHTLLQRYTRPGVTETEVSQRASHEATLAMLDAIGPLYRAQSYFAHGAEAGYRGQIGRNAAIPHALAANLTFQPGDVLVTGASAMMWGYFSELERTMIIGTPTDAQKYLFDHMLALQELAIHTLRPGIPCADVDRTLRTYYAQHDLMPYWKHHVGHAIGLRYHEGPFLDHGDETIIQPGMVFTIEPGLYDKATGGYRHSDTVLVTEAGAEVLTYYPRDLESLTI